MSEYTDRVERGLKGCEAVSTGICPGCDTCRNQDGRYKVRWNDDDTYGFRASTSTYSTEEEAENASRKQFEDDWLDGDIADEPSFSWRSCGICGSSLGGDREPWHYVADGKIHHHNDACIDCVVYLANGDKPCAR